MQVPALFKKKQFCLLDTAAVEPISNNSVVAESARRPQLLEEVEVRTNRQILRQECISCSSMRCSELQVYLRKKLAKAENKALVYGPVKSRWAAAMLKIDVYRQVPFGKSEVVGVVIWAVLWQRDVHSISRCRYWRF